MTQLKCFSVVPFHKDYCIKEPFIVVNLKDHELLKYHHNVLFCFVHMSQIRSEQFYTDDIQRMAIFHLGLTDRGKSVPKSHKICKLRHAIVCRLSRDKWVGKSSPDSHGIVSLNSSYTQRDDFNVKRRYYIKSNRLAGSF